MDFKPILSMKTEKRVNEERERLFRVFMNDNTKKPIRDSAYIQFHILDWVLEDEKNIIEKRLEEMNVRRTKEPEAK